MKKFTYYFSACFFVFLFGVTVNAQTVGDRSPQTKIFQDQPIWTDLTSQHTFRVLIFRDYFACTPQSKIICWNAITGNLAEVQEFSPEDSVLIVNHKGIDYLYKWGCENRLKYIRIESPDKPKGLSNPLRPAPEEGCKPKASACNCDSECAGTLAVEWSLSASGGWVKDQCENFLPADKWFLTEYGGFRYPCTNCSLPAFTKGWIKACGRVYYINQDVDPGPRPFLTNDIHY